MISQKNMHMSIPSMKNEVTTFGHRINPVGKHIEDD
jgi:hypothetical protein